MSFFCCNRWCNWIVIGWTIWNNFWFQPQAEQLWNYHPYQVETNIQQTYPPPSRKRRKPDKPQKPQKEKHRTSTDSGVLWGHLGIGGLSIQRRVASMIADSGLKGLSKGECPDGLKLLLASITQWIRMMNYWTTMNYQIKSQWIHDLVLNLNCPIRIRSRFRMRLLPSKKMMNFNRSFLPAFLRGYFKESQKPTRSFQFSSISPWWSRSPTWWEGKGGPRHPWHPFPPIPSMAFPGGQFLERMRVNGLGHQEFVKNMMPNTS